MNLKNYIASLEAVDFQKSELLFKELTAEIKAIRAKGKVTTKVVQNSRLSAIVLSHTNLLVTFKVEEADYLNAWVYPPSVDKNHPFYENAIRKYINTGKAINYIKKENGRVGYVDLQKSKVYGWFTEINCDVWTTSLAYSDEKVLAEELAAIYLHELGHVFTYFQMLANAATLNQALHSANAAYLGTKAGISRIEVLAEVEKQLDVKFDDKDALVDANYDVVSAIILSKHVEKSRSASGSSLYDTRAWEFMSDQFASRHGAGRYLVTGLDKLNRRYGDSAYLSGPTFYLMEIGKLLVFLYLNLGLVGLPLLFLFFSPFVNTYDDTAMRFTRIRNQITEALKDRNNTPERKKRLLEDLTAIDEVSKAAKDRYTFNQMFHLVVSNKARRFVQQRDIQNQLEQLMNNSLFENAARFDTINT